ncbi:MAG: DNA polymerase epsilon catalytic subunit [Watsoniomyces obsoletus]|nr:MAG: DNA polymerase epsilon catalytic subunit [Watsoniomyces obsoletus]
MAPTSRGAEHSTSGPLEPPQSTTSTTPSVSEERQNGVYQSPFGPPSPSASDSAIGEPSNVNEVPKPPMSVGEIFRSITWDEVKNFHKQVCVRDSLLAGILGGFVIGGGRAILGAPIPKAANWAVGAFACASLGAHEFCMYRRRREIEGMQLALKVMEKRREKGKGKGGEQQEGQEKQKNVSRENLASMKQRPRYWTWFWRS